MTEPIINPTEGSSPAEAEYTRVLGALGLMSGDDVYFSGYHFTAIYYDATKIELRGGFPAIHDPTQFVALLQRSTTGVVTVLYPDVSLFTWDPATDRLNIAGAAFATTDKFQLVVRGEDRAKSLPSNTRLSEIINHYPLRSDDRGIELITAPQNFTANWVDLGTPEISLFGKNTLKLFLTIDINDTLNPRIRILDKHESGGVEEYSPVIETLGTSDIKVEPAYWELNVDADQLLTLLYKSDGVTPFGQVQMSAGTAGATPGTVAAAYYTTGWR